MLSLHFMFPYLVFLGGGGGGLLCPGKLLLMSGLGFDGGVCFGRGLGAGFGCGFSLLMVLNFGYMNFTFFFSLMLLLSMIKKDQVIWNSIKN